MDEAAVERAVLLGWYWENSANCEGQNRFYAKCVREHPDRLSAFATVQPLVGGAAAVAELRRSRDEGLVGIGELSPQAQGYGVESESFRTVLARAAEWGWPVNLHVTDPASGNYPGRVETPRSDFGRLARDWPGVRFILAHWGGGLAWENPAEMAALENVYYDTAASPLLYPASVWSRGVGAAGAGRVIFGSDFPLNLYPRLEPEAEMRRVIAEANASGLDQKSLAAILGENAERMIAGKKRVARGGVENLCVEPGRT